MAHLLTSVLKSTHAVSYKYIGTLYDGNYIQNYQKAYP